ncbi:hypothetical protein BGY98DRAFT_1005576 [Russula aff. rugulosa BPL654]|nr:hypothetical protein BGY98DRAFT_1005576 [Russula aff. rugulosa BPL654]
MSLGTPTSNNATNSFSPSKSDSVPVASWHRGVFEYHLHKKLTARSSPSAATHVSSPHTQPQPTSTFMFHVGHVTTLANRRD